MDSGITSQTSAPGGGRAQALKDSINEYWSKGAEGYHKSVWRSIRSDRLKKTWQGVFRKGLGDGKLKVLDIGTGPGIVAFLLADMGHTVTGVDQSEEMLKKARENAARLKLPVEFRQGDAENLPFEDESFDAVINRHVLWTLPDPERALREWKRVLRPGGRLVIVDGNWDSNLKGSVKNQAWNLLSMPLITVTERRNAFRKRHHPEWDGRLPMLKQKRPEYDLELLKALGFVDLDVTMIRRQDLGLLEHLKYGFFGDTFQVSARKGN